MLLRTASSHATTAVMVDHQAIRWLRTAVVSASQKRASCPRRRSEEHQESSAVSCQPPTSIQGHRTLSNNRNDRGVGTMELSLKVGDGGNRKGGISWGCLTPPLLHRRSDMPCPKITSSS